MNNKSGSHLDRKYSFTGHFFSAVKKFILLTLITATVYGCSDSPTETDSDSIPTQVRVLFGDNAAAEAGNPLSEPVRIQVLGQGNNPVPGTPVSFTVTLGEGSVEPADVVTDSQGQASAV